MRSKNLLFTLLVLLIVNTSFAQNKLKAGIWRGVLTSPSGNNLPFNFDVADVNGKQQIAIHNGAERFKVTDIRQKGVWVFIHMPLFNSKFKLRFEGIDSGYQFLNAYCRENNIETEDHPEDKLISTRDITDLKVVNADGKEIKGVASSISGMDADGFEITIEGIPYPFYETEFPHHVLAYNQRY